MVNANVIDGCGLASETGLLIEDALKGVREAARLDADPVLPPLPVLAPRRDVVVFKRDAIPWPRPTPAASMTPVPVAGASQMPTVKVRDMKPKRRSGFPIVLCAFVASIAGGAAFMASPLGARPEVRHAVDATRVETVKAFHVAASFASRIHI
jgi:hypothetical protein